MEISKNKGLFGINNPLINNRGGGKKYPNLAHLSKDTVSFTGNAKPPAAT